MSFEKISINYIHHVLNRDGTPWSRHLAEKKLLKLKEGSPQHWKWHKVSMTRGAIDLPIFTVITKINK